ncbi:MAG: right-handed parallel beta-helix repeat-containing protein [Rhodanobacteraceae bacterium]
MLGLALMLWAGAAAAVDFLVNSAADKVDINPGDGICDADPGAPVECTLRAAIMEANALPNDPGTPPGYDRVGIPSGYITLTLGGTGEDASATGDLDVTDPVLIQGAAPNRPTVDGGGLDRVFDIQSTVILQDLIIRNGHATGAGITGAGGGVRCFGGTLALLRDIVRNNSTATLGGGVHAENCELSVSQSLIENNTADNGAGIYSRFANLSVAQSTVRGNQATSSAGGIGTTATDPAVYAYVYQSTISGNSGVFGAGLDFGNRAYVVNSTVSGNQADYGGGAGIRTFNALRISSSTIYCNHSVATDPNYAAGVALQGSSPSVSIDHSILARNTNLAGESECNGPLNSGGYNLIGDITGCTIAGTSTGNQTGLDPLLAGPFSHPLASASAGGLAAWLPRSKFGPTVDMGNPAGSTYDNDADPGTADVPLTSDHWNLARPADGDGDGTARPDIGAVESPVIMIDGFDPDPGACPVP